MSSSLAPHPQHEHEIAHHHDHDHAHHGAKKPHSHGCCSHGHAHHDHEHAADASWLVRHRELVFSLLSGATLLAAFLFERFGFAAPIWGSFYAFSFFFGGYDLARHTLPTILARRFDVEFLMLAGALGAAILGRFAEGAFLLFLFSLGHALEHYAMDRARGAIHALGKLTPKTALVRREAREIEIPTAEIALGDLAIVRAGERIPVDGTVILGHSSVDQSPITGESVPVEKAAGDAVFAGSINGDGALEIEVTKLAHDSTLARVLRMVEEAQTQKAPSQKFSESFERVFVPLVLCVVVCAAILPPVLGVLSWNEALIRAISTLVAASPCALALATPAAVLAGIAQAARSGVLIKGGVHLENLGALRAVAFDKTGTLTVGRPQVCEIVTAPEISPRELLQIAASVEAHSGHPLGEAVVARAQSENIALLEAGELQSIPGRGLESRIGERRIRIGNAAFLRESQIEVPSEIEGAVSRFGEAGMPTMIVARDAQVLGAIGLADALRPNARQTLEKLRNLGVQNIVMLTGDNEKVARSLAIEAGFTEFRAGLLPENKVTALRELLEKYGKVAMIGDGVNDAPALASATVGIAMGASGTDVALETADVALMGDDLGKLPFAVGLSRQAKAIIRQNLWISLGVIALLVPSTLLGLAPLGVAVIFHEGSTILVCLNALRLLRYR